MKKRKLLISILTGFCVCLTSATLLTACKDEHTHSYTQQTTTNATCTEKGVITYTCSCNDTYTEEIPALGHEYALYVENFDEHGESLGTETAECLHGCGTEDERLIEYTLICIADGETVAEKTFTIETEDFDLPEIPEREGYSSKWGDIEYVDGEFFVVAEYTPITYTITYELNGGTNSEINPATYTIESGAIPLYKPTKTYGTTFVNWYTDENFSEESKVLTIPKRSHGDITLYAKWIDYRIEVAEYFDIDFTKTTPVLHQEVHNATVNMDLNSEIVVSDGCTWALYSDFEGRDKYPLKAMTLQVGLNQAYVIVNHPDGEHFTRYLLSIYRLGMKPYAFMNGLSVYNEGVVEEKSTVNAPAVNPTQTGYTFKHWSANGQKVTFPYTVLLETTFVAEYTPITYSITYRLNGGTNSSYNPTSYTIEDTKYLENPTRTGYTFDGWYTESTFVNPVTAIIPGTYGNKTLYAKWTPTPYTITYQLNGGTNDSANVSQYNIESNTITLANPTRTGYTFDGWYTESTFVNKVTQIPKGSYGHKTFYAKWTPVPYTITYQLNGGAWTSNTHTDSYTIETATFSLPTTVEKAGYTFGGWYKESALTNKVTSVSKGTYGNKTYYAKWTANSNTLQFNGNGATGGSMSSVTVKTDATYTLKANAFTRTGYTFIGWATTPDGEVAYEDKSVYTMGTDSTYTLYAKWISYTVTTNTNMEGAGTYTQYTQEKITVGKTVKLTATTNTGYTWLGWYCGEERVSTSTSYSFTMEKDEYVFTAKWDIIKYNITYHLDGGTNNSANPQYITHLSIPITLQKPIKTGYTFKGWYTNSTLTTSITTLSSLQTYTLYAKWEYGSEGLQYSLSNSQYEVTDYTGTDKNVYIPSTYNGYPVTSIGYGAFEYCTSLTSIVIPDSVTSIGWYAFQDCTSLTSVEIGDSVTSIGNGAFYACNSLTSVEIGDSVTSIGDYAFYNCDSLTSVEIGNSVTSIGYKAFAYCDSLTSVEIPDSVTTIGYGAFYGCSRLTSITVSANNTKYKSVDGNLYSKDGKTLIQYAIEKTATSFTIPDSVTSIGDGAFYNCDSLTSVEIPDSVTSIGDGAFEYCDSLTKVNYTGTIDGWAQISFGDEYANPLYYAGKLYINNVLVTEAKLTTATKISHRAFYNCDSLTSVVIPDSVTSIGNGAFYACNSLTSVVIGDSVTSIGDYAFARCSSLTSVVIGDSVTLIGEYAFYYCYRLSVYYKGTASDWSGISICSDNASLTSATRYYYIENEADVPTDGGKYWHYDENGEIAVW